MRRLIVSNSAALATKKVSFAIVKRAVLAIVKIAMA